MLPTNKFHLTAPWQVKVNLYEKLDEALKQSGQLATTEALSNVERLFAVLQDGIGEVGGGVSLCVSVGGWGGGGAK